MTKNKKTVEEDLRILLEESGGNFDDEYDPALTEVEIKQVEQDIEKSIADKRFTENQSKFIEEYFISFEPYKAAIKAGYSTWSAQKAATRIMDNPKVKEEIERRRELLRKRYEISPNRVLEEYSKISYSNPLDFFDDEGKIKDVNKISEISGAALNSIEIDPVTGKIAKFKMADKRSALADISKHLGVFENSDKMMLEMGLTKLLKLFPEEVAEKLKVAMLKKVEGKLLK